MSHEDTALSFPNPRLLTAIYFALLAIIITCAIDLFLFLIGEESFLELFKAIILAVVVAGGFGALFGKLIIYSPKPYRRKAFFYGFLMVLAAVPFYYLGFLFLKTHFEWFSSIKSTEGAFVAFFRYLFYSYIFAGIWLGIAAGFAAMYLRGHLVYDMLLHSEYFRFWRH